ncbi:hypothetical protein LSM04_009082 [Trypanosoma melophagium]|uniref:uncharacterized protein n=1 Tax=Trypanosoma melophagium TaxID=715481 RepID=UPI00351AAE6B|nr:hypothetical protein LSM04_009082 [Trypanosoma melophagium]
MFFTLDGLPVTAIPEQSSSSSLSLEVTEGQKLIALYRLLHRLHHTHPAQETNIHNNNNNNNTAMFTANTKVGRVPFPEFLTPEHSNEVSSTGATPGVWPQENGTVNGEEGGNAGCEDYSNTNRAANGMEESHIRVLPTAASTSTNNHTNNHNNHNHNNNNNIRGGGRGGVESTVGITPTLQLCTSQRKLFCVQRCVPGTNETLFLCCAVHSGSS